MNSGAFSKGAKPHWAVKMFAPNLLRCGKLLQCCFTSTFFITFRIYFLKRGNLDQIRCTCSRENRGKPFSPRLQTALFQWLNRDQSKLCTLECLCPKEKSVKNILQKYILYFG